VGRLSATQWPPGAASGAACSTTVPYAVPDIRASLMRTMSRTTFARSFAGSAGQTHAMQRGQVDDGEEMPRL
jgi:hypothetical protein